MKFSGLFLITLQTSACLDVLLARRALQIRGLRRCLEERAYEVTPLVKPPEEQVRAEALDASAFAKGRAVNRAARLMPGYFSCLTRALALSRMLCREQTMHELIISTRRGQGTLAAHAWIRCRGQVLIGAGPMTEAPALVVMTPKF